MRSESFGTPNSGAAPDATALCAVVTGERPYRSAVRRFALRRSRPRTSSFLRRTDGQEAHIGGCSVKVFVSYRRDDSRLWTERLCDRLRPHFGNDAIFMDVDSIPLGTDVRSQLSAAVATCDVFLAIIGDTWLTITDSRGRRRLDDENDFVRIEIESALQCSLPVIPVLVNGATMPAAEGLPRSMQPLAFCQGAVLRSDPDFHRDVDRLVRVLTERILDDVIADADAASAKSLLGPLEADELFQMLSATIGRDPRNIDALLKRGQYAMVRATQGSGKGYRQATDDFLAVRSINAELADPHYGLGTLYYNLAMLDLLKRGRYKIHHKGKMRINPQTSVPEMIHPGIELFLDDHSRAQFSLSLEEFETGQRLQQAYSQEGKYTHVMFASQDVERRVYSLRTLLGYAPMTRSDDWLVQVFTTCVTRLDPEGFTEIFELVGPNAENARRPIRRWWQIWK